MGSKRRESYLAFRANVMEKKCERCRSNGFYGYENAGFLWLCCLDCDKIHGPWGEIKKITPGNWLLQGRLPDPPPAKSPTLESHKYIEKGREG